MISYCGLSVRLLVHKYTLEGLFPTYYLLLLYCHTRAATTIVLMEGLIR